MHWMFLPLKRYAEFSGRSRRLEYWMFALGLFILYFLAIILVVAMVGAAFVGGAPDFAALGASMGGALILLLLLVLASFALFIPSLAVSVRRLHDIDFSGHWVWIYWGPYIAAIPVQFVEPTLSAVLSVASLLGALALLVMAMIEGTRGPNRFGPDPKQGGEAEIFA